ncbi:MAG: hypothetical protein WCD75_10250 [Rhodoplanes sp.]
MTEIKPKLEIKLDPKRLAAIVDSAVVSSTEIVNFHINALSGADLNKAPELAETIYKFRGPELNAVQRRTLHENWILAKSFHELLRAVRHALEEAHVFAVLLTKKHKVRTNATLSEFLKPFQSKAASLKFPCLLAAVNELLKPKLEFAASYRSLQTARNCLEHQDGIVSKIETHGKETFDLSIPRVKLFYMRGGVEVEIAKGHTVDSGDDRAEVEILTKIDVRKRSLALGERLTFTLSEFNEIAFACHLLGQQLSSKLPRPTIVEE